MRLIDILFVLVTFSINIGNANCQKEKRFFREDYKFLASQNAFYKFVLTETTWSDAVAACKMEGAYLFYPESQNEVQEIGKFFLDIHLRTTQGWVGAFYDGQNYWTVDGRQLQDLYYTWSNFEPSSYYNYKCMVFQNGFQMKMYGCDFKQPFFCKKTLDSLEWNYECNTPYAGYNFNSTLNRCYKYSQIPRNWVLAEKACEVELARLAIIDSEDESDHLVDVVVRTPLGKVYDLEAVCLGFYMINETHWNTVRDYYLHESDYVIWHYTQPDGGVDERCGAMSYTGRLHDIDCDKNCFYMCELEV